MSRLRADLERFVENAVKDDSRSLPGAGDILAFLRVSIDKLMLNRPAHKPTGIVPNAEGVFRVFISYSWDSEKHKVWVLALAKRLREDGIDAIIDQTHLSLGARSPEFMERSVRESRCVLVVCTETYKGRFDSREGGAGYEGHIITGEIINEVGGNKFIPVLRSGDWKSAMPTALSGTIGVDLRNDSPDEYRRLVKRLHGLTDIQPVGPRPGWLDHSSDRPTTKRRATPSDPNEFWEQRRLLPETAILKKIWSKPRWHIWIRSTEFRRARFQNLQQCRQFMRSSQVGVQGWLEYPRFSTEAFESGDEWIAGQIDVSDISISLAECWALFRSGQFIHNRAFDEIPQLGDRVHVLEILDTATATFEFAARMAHRSVLSPLAVITFELHGVDGRGLTWPENAFGDNDAVGPNCWCQAESVSVTRLTPPDALEARRRELALEVALEIYSKFEWSDPPRERLSAEQNRRFAAVQEGQN